MTCFIEVKLIGGGKAHRRFFSSSLRSTGEPVTSCRQPADILLTTHTYSVRFLRLYIKSSTLKLIIHFPRCRCCLNSTFIFIHIPGYAQKLFTGPYFLFFCDSFKRITSCYAVKASASRQLPQCCCLLLLL